MCAAIGSSMVLALEKSASEPPTRKVFSPAAMDCTPPAIAASTKPMFAVLQIAAKSRATFGVIVLVSMTVRTVVGVRVIASTTAREISGRGNESNAKSASATTASSEDNQSNSRSATASLLSELTA